MAWTLKLPIIGVSSLEAMALGAAIKGLEEANKSECWIVPLMDARRAQAYTALYSLQGEKWQCLAEDGIRLVEHWLEQITKALATIQAKQNLQATSKKQYNKVKVSFVGEMTGFLERLKLLSLVKDYQIELQEAEVSALHIGLLGSLRLAAGERSDVHQIIPNYTQLTEAETNLLAKTHGEDGE